MANFPAPTPRPKTVLNDYGQPHPETEQPVQGARYNGALRFEQKSNGDIVLRCYDNVFSQGGEKRQIREVTLNYNERGVLFDYVRQAADMSVQFSSAQLPINQTGWLRENGQSKPTPEPVNMCNFIIGRDDKGRVSLTYQKGDFSFKTVFRMHNVPSVRYKTTGGEVVEDFGGPSRSSARTWCNFHEPLLNKMYIDVWKPKEPKGGNGAGNNNWNKPNNNNGGGNNGSSNSGGSMNATTEEFDTELDW